MEKRKQTALISLLSFFTVYTWFSASVAWAGPQNEKWIRVDLWKRRLYVMEENHILAEFMVGIGKKETPTPIGDWVITDKSREWGGGFGPCWLGLNVPWGQYGIHGTNKPHSVGSKASQGCLRLLNTDIIRLYNMVSVGTRVRIDGPILGFEEWELPRLVRGSKGTPVQLVQNRLRSAGFYRGAEDGVFGEALEKAVLRFQKERRLEATGQIGTREWMELGLIE
jgi:hypothetical protein